MLAGKVSNKSPRFGTFCVSQSIIRVEPDRLIEVTDSFAIVVEIPTLKVKVTLEVRVMSFHILRRISVSRIRSKQRHFQRLGDCSSDFLLNGKDIFQFPIERPRPELDSVASVHEFGHDPHPVALLANRAIQKRAHTQLLTNFPGFLFSVFESERRAATNNFEPSDLSQGCDQFFRQAIRKIFFARIAAQIFKRQNGDSVCYWMMDKF